MKKIVHNPYKIVQMFEEEVAEYTGAPYAISVDSCTNALFLCCKYLNVTQVTIPKYTYLSVPMSIIHSGAEVVFEDRKWSGVYKLEPYPIFDAAKRFTSDMYIPGAMMFAAEWFKKARYEGRSEMNYQEDDIDMLGWNMYMTPQQASHGLALMQNYPEHVKDLGENKGYRDLSKFKVFEGCKVL